LEKETFTKLVQKAIDGDKDAFERIYDMKFRVIFYHAKKMLRDEEEAKDAAQDIVLQMYKHISKLQAPEAFNVWLMRIISNTCIGASRKKKRDLDVNAPLDDLPHEIEEGNKEFIPHEWGEHESVRESLRTIIEKLPKKRRMAILMYYYDEMNYREIAAALGVSINTVSTNIMKAKAMIKEEIEKKNLHDSLGSKFAAVPVLTFALQEDEAMVVASNHFAAVKESVGNAVFGNTIPNQAVAAKSGAKFAVIFTAGVVAISVIVVAIVLGISYNPADDLPAYIPGGEVNQVVEPTDETTNAEGQISEVKLYDVAEDVQVSWELINEERNLTIATGEGLIVSEPIAELYREKANGNYAVVFTCTDPSGKVNKVIRDFEIITD
jgi:RNA polymerase sigma-70 factor (ECF subfamily)